MLLTKEFFTNGKAMESVITRDSSMVWKEDMGKDSM
jgi:hypothetical protein